MKNGFNVGEKVYYISEHRGDAKMYGIVVNHDNNNKLKDDKGEVWACWCRDVNDIDMISINKNVGWMPTVDVFRVEIPRRNIHTDLKIGDRVVALDTFIKLNDVRMIKGNVAIVSEIRIKHEKSITFNVNNSKNWCDTNHWELEENYLADNKEAAVPVVNDRKGKYDFRVGDKVRLINNEAIEVGWFEVQRLPVGSEFEVVELGGGYNIHDAKSAIKIKSPLLPRQRFVWTGCLELVVEEEKKEGPMTRFVFCSRGGKYYEKGDFNSLEAATAQAKKLRRHYNNADIHPFVIVED